MAQPTFRMFDIIAKKRDGGVLSDAEIRWTISEYSAGAIPDYQMSALLMAICLRGMDESETTALTKAMVASGDQLDLSPVQGAKVDKHSTGGVGDKTTLVLIPAVAASGLGVAKMSGRGLGYTGGTLDKLESIPGVRTDLSQGAFLAQLQQIGAVVCGQTANLTPADKKLYALRDVTATVESIPLVAASVMSKKIAAGADAILLDVKVGRAAFMKSKSDALKLAETMVAIAKGVGRPAVAWVTRMDQPLGWAVGNLLEVYEAVETLQGAGPPDLRELCVELGAEMLVLGRVACDLNEGRTRLADALASGAAYDVFERMIAAQGGNLTALSRMKNEAHPEGYVTRTVHAEVSGGIECIDGLEVGLVAMSLGAGRATKDDEIDPHVGVRLRKKVGDHVTLGEPLVEVVARNDEAAGSAEARLREAFEIGPKRESPAPALLIHRVE